MRICLLTGGASAERDVALASGAQMLAALRRRGHDVVVVDTATGEVPTAAEGALFRAGVSVAPPDLTTMRTGQQQVLGTKLASLGALRTADVVCLALHGGDGEGGTVQAMLDILGVAYTGSGVFGSAVALDKDTSKRLFRDAGIPTPDWVMAPRDVSGIDVVAIGDRLGWPLIVKPVKQGSSVALSKVGDASGLVTAIVEGFRHDDEVMIEAFVPGREFTVGVLDGVALAVGEIVPKNELFDYESKYQPGMSEETFPADIPASWAAECRDLALTVHRLLKLGSYSRVDFRVNADGRPSCLEANTLPGMTATSLLPQSAAAVGISFDELCERICLAAIGRR